ncbi:MAG: DJ-1/PfpI family protein [Spirochaetia bacterium]
MRNRQATCYPDKRVVTVLKMMGAEYTKRSVVVADRIVTENGPDAAGDFAARVLQALAGG